MSLRKYLTSKVFFAQLLAAMAIVGLLAFFFFHWITEDEAALLSQRELQHHRLYEAPYSEEREQRGERTQQERLREGVVDAGQFMRP